MNDFEDKLRRFIRDHLLFGQPLNLAGGDSFLEKGIIDVDLSPLSTTTASKIADDGNFCPAQARPGCFGSIEPECTSIIEHGMPLDSATGALTLASVFCIPETSSTIINSSGSLPGPGAVTLPGTIELERN